MPDVHSDADTLIKLFEDKTISAFDLAALVGAHSTSSQDVVDANFAGAPQDSTPGVWDVAFYSETTDPNAPSAIFKFPSDVALSADPRTQNSFLFFGNDPDGQTAWNDDFARAYVRLSLLGVPNIDELVECTSKFMVFRTTWFNANQICRGLAIPDQQLRDCPKLLQRRQQHFILLFILLLQHDVFLHVICIWFHLPKQLCYRRSIPKQQRHWNLQLPNILHLLNQVLHHLCQDDIICHQVHRLHEDGHQDTHNHKQGLCHQVLRDLHHDHRLPCRPIKDGLNIQANNHHHKDSPQPQSLLCRSKWRELCFQASHHPWPSLQLDIRILQATDCLHHGHRVLDLRSVLKRLYRRS